MTTKDLGRLMGFNLTPSAEDNASAYERLAARRADLARQYRAEVDRRKAKLDNSPGPEMTQGLTNQNARDLAKLADRQAYEAQQQALKYRYGGTIPTNDWDLASATQAMAGPPRLSAAEAARQANEAWMDRQNVPIGGMVETEDGKMFIRNKNGYSLVAQLPQLPKEGATPDYQRFRALKIGVLKHRNASEGLLSDADRWAAPYMNSVSLGTYDVLRATQGGAVSAANGQKFLDGFDFQRELAKQQQDRLEMEHPLGAKAMSLAGDVTLAVASEGTSIPAQIATKTVAKRAIEGAVKGALPPLLSNSGTWDERLGTMGRRALTSAGLNIIVPYLPQSAQNSIVQSAIGNATDQVVDAVTGNAKASSDPYVISSQPGHRAKFIYDSDGSSEGREPWQEMTASYDFDTPPPLTLGEKGSKTFAQVYPLSSGLRESAQPDDPELPLDPQPTTVVDGKMFISGDPRDPRNWLTLPKLQ